MRKKSQLGFTLIEMMVSLAIFLTLSAVVMSGIVQMMKTQGKVANRTEMHASVRSATELLQQEIGQAGRMAVPAAVLPLTMTGPIVANKLAPQTFPISATANMYPGMLLDVDVNAGKSYEVVTLTAVTANTISAVFTKDHGTVGAPTIPVQVTGAFGTGIVPPTVAGLPCATPGYTAYVGPAPGSDCNTLKLYGDINADGNIVYVEYTCDTTVVPGFLYRNQVPLNGAPKLAVNPAMYLLNNVMLNPGGAGCFTYQIQNASVAGVATPFVTDVAVTITVQTQFRDPNTNRFENETKALLNITPRNVFYVWEATSLGEVPRNQPMPPNIGNLLPMP